MRRRALRLPCTNREFEQTARNPGNANADVTFGMLHSQKLRLRLHLQVAGCLLKLTNEWAMRLPCSAQDALALDVSERPSATTWVRRTKR